jgi:hypothetical protein
MFFHTKPISFIEYKCYSLFILGLSHENNPVDLDHCRGVPTEDNRELVLMGRVFRILPVGWVIVL